MVQRNNYSETNSMLYLARLVLDDIDYIVSAEKSGDWKRRILKDFLSITGGKVWVTRTVMLNKALLDAVIEGLASVGYAVLVMDARLSYKLVTGVSSGLGSEVFEVGIAWHPILDTPYIPGSSIKGAVRRYVETVLEMRDIAGKLFGTRRAIGALFFSDAFPVQPGRDGMILAPDILTPHYYRGGRTVEQELYAEIGELKEKGALPTPVLHFSVSEKTLFRFVVGIEPEKAPQVLLSIMEEEKAEPRKAALILAAIVKNALRTLGIGSRTAKGYGRFTPERVFYKIPGSTR